MYSSCADSVCRSVRKCRSKSAMLQIFRNRDLWQRSRRERRHEFQPFDRILEPARSGPTNAVAGRKTFGKRAAMQDKPFAVESLRRSWPGSTKIELGVDIVLDERNVALREHADQFLLAVICHAAAKRVLKASA